MTPVPNTRSLEVRRLGTVSYPDGLALQRELVEQRRAGAIDDVLVLLQHPPVITLGVKGDGGRSSRIAATCTVTCAMSKR